MLVNFIHRMQKCQLNAAVNRRGLVGCGDLLRRLFDIYGAVHMGLHHDSVAN